MIRMFKNTKNEKEKTKKITCYERKWENFVPTPGGLNNE